MEWIPLPLAVAALVAALIALARASSALSAAQDAGRDAQRRASGVEESLRAEIDSLRGLLVKVADGQTVSEEMIMEGQLWRDVGVDEGRAIADDGGFVLDVRTRQETDLGVVAGAALIPMDEIQERTAEIPRDGRPILVYCAAGVRSAAVCEHLSKEGFDALLNLEEGFGAWTGQTELPSNR